MSAIELTEDEQREIFRRNLTFQVMATGKQQIEIAHDLGISQQRMNNWMTGVSLPRIGMVEKLARYFCIPKSRLLDPQPKDEEEQREKDENERLIEAYQNAIPPIQRAVRVILGLEGGDAV